jgi:hypothetical protein
MRGFLAKMKRLKAAADDGSRTNAALLTRLWGGTGARDAAARDGGSSWTASGGRRQMVVLAPLG